MYSAPPLPVLEPVGLEYHYMYFRWIAVLL